MRLATLIFATLAVPFLSSFCVLATHLQLPSRRELKRKSPSLSSPITLRQHREPRALIDLCIDVEANLLADVEDVLGLVLDPLDINADLRLCLCLKDLDLFLETNVDIVGLVNLLGRDKVSALITALINTCPKARKCTLPPHAHRTCNNNDPCHFECDEHWVRKGNACVCAPPRTTCNGVCGTFSRGCGSAVPKSLKPRNGPIVAFAQAKAHCKSHETVCGVAGREGTLDFECLDIRSDPSSCGGCMLSHPFPEPNPFLLPLGEDCSRIPNAKAVACAGGRCAVNRCKDGWVASLAQDKCVRDTKGPSRLQKNKKRVLDAGASAKAFVDSRLVEKLSVLVSTVVDMNRHVSSLNRPSFASPYSPSSDLSAARLLNLINIVSARAADLMFSSSVSSFPANIESFGNANTLLRSTLTECGCVDRLALEPLVKAVDAVVTATLDIQNYRASNPLVSNNDETSTDLDLPIAIRISDLFSGLSSKETKSGDFKDMTGNPMNALFDRSIVGPRSQKRDDSVTLMVGVSVVLDSNLLAQVKALTLLVVGVSSVLPPPGSSTLHANTFGSNVVEAVLETTADLLASSTIVSFVLNLNNLVNINALVLNTLNGCECVEDLGLEKVFNIVVKVSEATLSLRNWCDRHPVAHHVPGSGSPPSIIPNTSKAPITLGLSHLLPGSGSGSVKGSATVGDAHLSGVSNAVNDLLSVGPNGVRHRGSHVATVNVSEADVNLAGFGNGLSKTVDSLLDGSGGAAKPESGADVVNLDLSAKLAHLVGPDILDSHILTQIDTLINSVIDLNTSSTSLPTAISQLSGSLTDLVDFIVRSTVDLVEASTFSSLELRVEDLVAVNALVKRTLDECKCIKDLEPDQFIKNFVKVTNAALDIQNSCRSHSQPLRGTAGFPLASTTPKSGLPITLDLSKFLVRVGLATDGGVFWGSGDGVTKLLGGPRPNELRRRVSKSCASKGP